MTNPPPYSIAVAPASAPIDSKRVVRAVLMVFGVFGAVIIAVVFGVIWIVDRRIENTWLVVAILGAVLLLLLIPVIVFSLSANWAYASTPEGSRVFRRAVLVMSALQLLCLAAVIAFGAVTGPPLWVVITLAACGIAFAPIGIVLGRVLRSAPVEVDIVPLEGWTPPIARRRDPLPYVAGGVFLIIVVLGLLVVQPWNFPQRDAHDVRFAFSGLLIFVDFAALGAMVVCLVRVVSTAAALRAVASRDYVQARRIRQALSGRRGSDELLPIDLERARATAILSIPQLGWMMALESLLFVSLSLSQASSFVGTGIAFSGWVAVFTLTVGVILVVLFASRIAALRRYVAAHPHPQPGGPAA